MCMVVSRWYSPSVVWQATEGTMVLETLLQCDESLCKQVNIPQQSCLYSNIMGQWRGSQGWTVSRPCPTPDTCPVTLVALQLYNSTLILCASLWSWMHTYPSAKCNPLHQSPSSHYHTALSTLLYHEFSVLFISPSILQYFLWTQFIFIRPDLDLSPVVPCPPFGLFTCDHKYSTLVLCSISTLYSILYSSV